jgi:hypothetical protein
VRFRRQGSWKRHICTAVLRLNDATIAQTFPVLDLAETPPVGNFNKMPYPSHIEEYSNAFPSSWASISSPKTSSIQQHQEEPRQGSTHPQNPAGERPPITTPSSQHKTHNIVSRDFAYPPVLAGSDTAEVKKISSPAKVVKVPTILEPSQQPDAISAEPIDDPQYSAVYPPSWTVFTNPSATKSEMPSLPVHKPPPAPSRTYSERSPSTTSQGDVIPKSPSRRRMQQEV